MDLLWPAALDGDDACAFVRAAMLDIVEQLRADGSRRRAQP
jgi:LysR family transcriptional activator of mexEF-oprN operon